MNELEQQFMRKITIFEPIKDIQILFDNNYMIASCMYKFNHNEELMEELRCMFCDDEVYNQCNEDLNNIDLSLFLDNQLERLQNEEKKKQIPDEQKVNLINTLINNQK